MDKIQPWYEPLNTRETEILRLLSDGLSNREIARKLQLSLDTVKWYNKQIYSKLGASSRTQAAAIAKEHQILEDEGEETPPKGSLPVQLTSFVGREEETEEILALLKSSRLVTLTGPGGTGKTRLAIHTAERAAGYFRDGVFLVELATTADPDFVPAAIARVLQASLNSGETIIESLVRRIGKRNILLLLDNFEHVLEAATLVVEMLSRAPNLSVLATSRERLNVSGEQEYSVQPLDVPDPDGSDGLKRVLETEAVSLFVQRAQAVNPRLKVEETQYPALMQIATRLDGLPLALELAASQVKMFPIERLASRLQESLATLPAGPRDLPSRQRTLMSTIQWSYDMLKEGERTLFSKLSVFRGGGVLESIEAVCGDAGDEDVLPVLTALVEKNLVRPREGSDGEIRYGMLETIREFALERLRVSGYYKEVLRRYTGYFVRMTAALILYWYYTGLGDEGTRWTELAISKMESTPPDIQASLLRNAGVIAYGVNDIPRSKELHRRALDLDRKLGDKRNLSFSMIFLAMDSEGNLDEYPEAMELGKEGLALIREVGDLTGIAQALNILGELARTAGELDEAQRYYQESLETVEKTGETLRTSMLQVNLSFIAHRQGRYAEAIDLMRQSLVIFRDLKNEYGIATDLAFFAGPLASLGYAERAALLMGAGNAMLQKLGAVHQPADQQEVERYREEVISRLGEEAYLAAWGRGMVMEPEQAIALALEDAPPKD